MALTLLFRALAIRFGRGNCSAGADLCFLFVLLLTMAFFALLVECVHPGLAHPEDGVLLMRESRKDFE